jgi:methyl-accepting chemotaxis protein
MSEESWRSRHRALSGFLWAEVPVLLLGGLLGPRSRAESLLLPLVVVLLALAAAWTRSPHARSDLTSIGLVAGAFIGIELSGGQLNTHLFILSAVALVALYQRWSPLLLTVGAVVVHHLLFGLLAPDRVMSMAGDAMAHRPAVGAVAVMVATHASAVLIEVIAILLWWHFAELAEHETARLRDEMEQARQATEIAQVQAATEAASTQASRAREASRRSEALAGDAVRIRDHAEDAVTAATSLEYQSDMLGTAVHEIAQRCQEAATTAATGLATTKAAALEVLQLEQAMTEIADVNTMIGQLAAQTNLLSLNATIEAARAGHLGRGFAVVAQEVKALANATAAAAEKVRTVVEGVVGETEKVAQNFRTTHELVGLIGAAQNDIAASVEEQAAVLAEVGRQTTAAADAGRAVSTALELMIAHSAVPEPEPVHGDEQAAGR